MVSYAKARAESLLPTREVGFWERPERLVLMILGALLNRMPLVLWILAIGPNITVVHRIVHTWRQMRHRDAAATVPPGDGATHDAQTGVAYEASTGVRVLTRSAGRGR